ncbi:hypothetical protein [Thermodesulfitimonas autotrophica]|uniref:hypothetical protein n=1 Tax=Thermodesulfitimonas autotrophica TaxID=1894989 RepID=UPI002FDF1086
MKDVFDRLFGKEGVVGRNPGYWLKIALLGVAGILLLAVSGSGGKQVPDTVATAGKRVPDQGGRPVAIRDEEKYVAERLKAVIQDIEGAGAVEVSVRLAGSTRAAYAVNTTAGRRVTEEKDRSGANRLTTEDNTNGQVVVVREGQREEPVVEKEEAPHILGVLVVADGAADPVVKAEIFRAVQVALGVEAHRVLVLPRQRHTGVAFSSGAEGAK